MKQLKGLLGKLQDAKPNPRDEGWRTAKEIQLEDAPTMSYSSIEKLLASYFKAGEVQRKKLYNPKLGFTLFHYKEVETELPPIKPPKKK